MIERVKKNRQLGILQPSVSSSKTRELLEASHRPKLALPVLKHARIQDGDSRINQVLPQKGRMGHLHRPDGHLSSRPYPPTVQEVPQIPLSRNLLPVFKPTFWAYHRSSSVDLLSEAGKSNGPSVTHISAPIPRRLANQAPSPHPHQVHSDLDTRPRFPSEHQEIRTHSHSEVQLHGLPLFARQGTCQTHASEMDHNSTRPPTGRQRPLLSVQGLVCPSLDY